MKIGKVLIVFAMLGILPTALAWAVQESVTDEDSAAPSPNSVESPSDLTVTDEELIPVATMVSCGKPAQCCDCPKGGCGLFGGCNLGEPWKLPQPCALQNAGIAVGGWIQQGFTYNSREPDDGFNGPVATNDWDGQYQMNQAWMFLHRPADNGGCGLAVGGHIDAMYGTDGRFGASWGLEENINGLTDYGIVIPQAYAEIAYNNLSVKLGKQAAILDYELIPAPPNPFYSHSYSYGYTVPQLVMGALADYKMTDRLSVQAGVHRGWFTWEDNNSSWDIMGGFKWATCDKRTSLAWAFSTGPQDPPADWNGVPADQERFVYSFVLQHQFTDRFKYVLVQNTGFENNGDPWSAGVMDAEWYGLNQYFLYTINPCLSANLRYEILRDDDGARIAGPGNLGLPAWTGAGFQGNFYELTAGLSWRPHANVLVRPEVRWDWYNGAPGFVGGVAGLPFDNGNVDEQFTMGMDMVITF